MISGIHAVNIVKAVAKGTWDILPAILAEIPATAIAGKVLGEVKEIVEEAVKANADNEEIKGKMDRFASENGGEEAVRRELMQEVSQQRAENPKYINCAIFTSKSGVHLTGKEMERLEEILAEKTEAEDSEIGKFVACFTDDYFGGDMDSCDAPYEINESYVSFNFDDCVDHEYLEEDLVTVQDYLNRIVGRNVFDFYESYGTNDSVKGLYY